MDILNRQQRSERMRRVRARGNRSTEWKLRSALIRLGIRGWRMHESALPGCPDFVFAKARLVVFVDGCFWHGCSRCDRPLPRKNAMYWRSKVKGNLTRAKL